MKPIYVSRVGVLIFMLFAITGIVYFIHDTTTSEKQKLENCFNIAKEICESNNYNYSAITREPPFLVLCDTGGRVDKSFELVC